MDLIEIKYVYIDSMMLWELILFNSIPLDGTLDKLRAKTSLQISTKD